MPAYRRRGSAVLIRKTRADIKIIVATAFLIFTVDSVLAQSKERAAMTGAGLKSCAEFSEDYREAPQTGGTIGFVWAQGLMSGENMMLMELKRPRHNLNARSTQDEQDSITRYCDQHPLAKYAEAVLD